MEREVRIGIIGCGGIANGKHLPALKVTEGVKMVAFCDVIVERAEKAAEEYGAPGAKVYEDYRELLKDESIEAVHVLTPNLYHSEITVAALDAGKHVMCEKPMAINAEEAKKMLDAQKRSGKILTIGYQNRQRADSRVIKAACERGDLGEIYFAKAHAIRRRAVPTWGVFIEEELQGGGPLIDIGTHALDLTLWMMDNYEPECVMGTSYHKLNNQTETGNAWGDWDPAKFTVEDSAFGFIRMKNGATIILESSWALNTLDVGEAKTTLCGTLGGADMNDGVRFNKADFGRLCEEKVNTSSGGVDFYEGASDNPGEREAYNFYDAIRNGAELIVKPEQAYVVSLILDAIYESAKTGKPVYFN